MIFPKLFAKEVFIRLDGDDAFVSTVKYGCLYSKASEFKVEWEALEPTSPEITFHPAYALPLITIAVKTRGDV